MKNLAFALVTSFLTSSVAFSQVAEQLLTQDILTSQKVMEADTKIYTYFTINPHASFNTLEGRREFVQRAVLSNAAGKFWDMRFTNDSRKDFACGPGLYFAIDPHISKQYGNSFIEMTIPKGTRFINVVQAIPVKQETINALIAEGFMTEADKSILFPADNRPLNNRKDRTGFYRDTLRAMVNPKYTRFRNLVQKIFATNGIQFVEYNFNTSLSGFCKHAKTSAFLFVGVKNLKDATKAKITAEFSSVDMYSTHVSFQNKSSEEVVRLNEILKFRTLLDDMTNLRASGTGVPKGYILQRYSSAEVQDIKDQTFNCK